MNIQVDARPTASVPAASQDFEDFIYLISHDVRNSVRALIEVPQWIAEDLSEAGYRIDGSLAENMGLMNTHTQRLDRMLADLLTYSRIGRMQGCRSVDLAEAVETICQEIRIPRSIRLEIDLQHPTLNIGDKDAMTLLSALILNALRHGDAGTSLIRIASRHEDDATVLTVVDDGPGIPPQFREKVFGAMITLKSRDEVDGSGMGLTHVRKVINHYGATLRWMDLDGTRGVGFEMRFPD
ncbi:MAG: ATP-binding protein [bacterium]